MSNYSTLKQSIRSVIQTNGNEEITGAVLQDVLVSIVDTIGVNYTFAGVATPQTNVGSPDQNVFYIGGAGTYTNFGTSFTVANGELGVFMYNGSWTKNSISIIEVVNSLNSSATDKALSAAQGKVLDEKIYALGGKVSGETIIKTVSGNTSPNYFDLTPLRGEIIYIKATGGPISSVGYRMSDGSYEAITTRLDTLVRFEVPQNATYLFVYNSSSVGTHEVALEVIYGLERDLLEQEYTFKSLGLKLRASGSVTSSSFSLNANPGIIIKAGTPVYIYASCDTGMSFDFRVYYVDDTIETIVGSARNGRDVIFTLTKDAKYFQLANFVSSSVGSNIELTVYTGIYAEDKIVLFDSKNSVVQGDICSGTNIIVTSATEKLASLIPYRGSKIGFFITGVFSSFGYYKTDNTYVALPENYKYYDIPQDATDFYVYSSNSGTFSWKLKYPFTEATEMLDALAGSYINNNVLPGYGDIDSLVGYLNDGGLSTFLADYNGTVTKQKIDNDEFLRIFVPSGATFSSGFMRFYFAEIDTKYGDDGYAKCYFRGEMRSTVDNYFGFKILTNNGWSTPNKTIKNVGNDFIQIDAYAEASGTPNGNVKFYLALYWNSGSAVTLSKNLQIDIRNFSFSLLPISSLGSYQPPLTKVSVNSVIKEEAYLDAKRCILMSLGDSITTESYYIGKLRQILDVTTYYNLAVAGAHWADNVGTIYDGNPVFNGSDNNVNNVLGNQVQKIINNIANYSPAPNVIIIAAGTNDAQPIAIDSTTQEITADIDAKYQDANGVIPVTTPTFDASDTYAPYRRTIAGAMRYCVCKLQELFPQSQIFILTPIQGAFGTRNYGRSISAKQVYISESAKHLGVGVVHVGEECGIQADFEYNGAFWDSSQATETHPQNGRDLIDGLHPNTNGSWKMAKYIAKELLNKVIDQDY